MVKLMLLREPPPKKVPETVSCLAVLEEPQGGMRPIALMMLQRDVCYRSAELHAGTCAMRHVAGTPLPCYS